MGKILITPAAKIAAIKENIDVTNIKGSGEFGSITIKDILNASPSEVVNKIKATPVAKNMAVYFGKDLSSITPSGNKIKKEDVLKSVSQASEEKVKKAPQEVVTTKIGGMRKVIADNMMNSLTNMAQLTQMSEIDTTNLVKFFKEAKETYSKFSDVRLTMTDVFVKLVSKALMMHPVLNQTFDGEMITSYPYVNMGLAVALTEGLIVPTIEDTANASLFEISKMRSDLVTRARENKLKPNEYAGATFTISNIGNGPGTYFTPVINPPQVGILGIGRSEEKPVVRDGEIVIRTMTYFSLTFDHQIADGMMVIEFLKTLEELIQNPLSVLL